MNNIRAYPVMEDGDIEVKELWISNGDRTIYGMLYEPAAEGKHPAVIMSHGYNGSHNDWTEEASLYAANGYVTYAYDFCGGSKAGRSSGNSTETRIQLYRILIRRRLQLSMRTQSL